jgi:predicted nucleic acid-binding Zn ribbon protein
VSDDESLRAPSQLRDVLSRLIRRRGLVETSAADELNDAWKQIAGPEIGKLSKVKKLQSGVLEILVFNGPALEQLRGFLHQQILSAMQERFPESSIRVIRYRRSR